MFTIPQYLLESSLCLLIFYGFYHLFLRKETFFQLNRAYLVATPALSLSIPLLNISFQKDAPAESFEAFLYPAIQSANSINDLVWEQMRAPSPVFSLSIADVLMAIYLVGVLLMGFSLLRRLWNLSRIIRKGKQSKNNEFTLVETQNNFPAASFFGYIFWNQQITDEQKLILEHEKVHIRQWHSLDVLLMEICVIIKWFNPLIYWFRTALKATHEYIADQYVIQQKSNVQDYATLLVNQQKASSPTLLTNTFYSMTTKRLKMMLQKPSNKTYVAKYLLIIPLISGLMLLFSFNLLEEIPQVSKGLIEMNAAINDLTETTVFEINEEFDKNLMDALVVTEDERFATLGKEETSNKVHFGAKSFSMNPFQQIRDEWKSNVISSQELIELLRQEISFTYHKYPLHIEAIELFIPKSNDGGALQIHTSKSANYKFAEQDFKSLIERLNPFDNVTLNIYGEHDTYITKFKIRGEKLAEKKKKKYQLFWGEWEILLTYFNDKYIGPGSFELPLKDFVKMVRQPIRITKFGQPFIPKKIDVSVHGKNVIASWYTKPEKNGKKSKLHEMILGGKDEDLRTNESISYIKPEEEPLIIEIAGKESMTFSEKEYEQIFQRIDGKVTVNIKMEDDYPIATTIIAKSQSEKYFPPYTIRIPNMEVYNFQLITPLKGKAILKIDTIKSTKIAYLYRDKSKYEIIHIPNFQTYERVLDEKLVKENDVHYTHTVLYNSITKTDLLPNLILEKSTDLQLKWGKLTAAYESEDLTLKEYYQNNIKTPQLFYQAKEMALKKLRMTIIGKKTVYSNTFMVTDFGTTKMAEILGKVENKTSIYFDKIEVLDEGRAKHLQHRFLFKVGNEVLRSSFGATAKEPKYQMKWGTLDIPIILNDHTNSTVAHFMTVEDFNKNIEHPFQLFKFGNPMENKPLEITFFDKASGNNWGIDKRTNDKNEYWEVLTDNFQKFSIDGRTKKHFSQEELLLIKKLAKEGWLMTIRSADIYLLYSSISLVPSSSILLQIDPDHWKKNNNQIQINERYPRDNRVDFNKIKKVKNNGSS